jgi:riboflavin synthase
MFTGIIEELGRVAWLRQSSENGLQLQLAAPLLSRELHRGDSVAVNGCCLTVSSHRGEMVTFNLLQETVARTNLRQLRPGALVNLERAVAADGRMGGHFVQGHVDCTSPVVAWEQKGDDYRLEVGLPEEQAHYVIHKGSIAISGISLTVAQINLASFTVWIIPHTRQSTSLSAIQAGDLVNLEFDMVAKYIERMLPRFQPTVPPQFTDRDLS